MTVREFATRQLWGLVVTCLLGVALVAGGLIWTGSTAQSLPSSPASDPAPSRAQELVEDHGCWTGPAPADMRFEVPGHVVVTTRAGRTVYGGPRLVSKALDQQFAHQRHGLVIHGFCR